MEIPRTENQVNFKKIKQTVRDWILRLKWIREFFWNFSMISLGFQWSILSIIFKNTTNLFVESTSYANWNWLWYCFVEIEKQSVIGYDSKHVMWTRKKNWLKVEHRVHCPWTLNTAVLCYWLPISCFKWAVNRYCIFQVYELYMYETLKSLILIITVLDVSVALLCAKNFVFDFNCVASAIFNLWSLFNWNKHHLKFKRT